MQEGVWSDFDVCTVRTKPDIKILAEKNIFTGRVFEYIHCNT